MHFHSPRIRIHGAVARHAVPRLLLLSLFLALLPLGCSDGDSPTAPLSATALSGTWTGTITGRPSLDGTTEPADLRLTLNVDEAERIENSHYEITYTSGERESGSVAGAFNHEVYLSEDGDGCVWQARFQTLNSHRLEGSWFGWDCGPRVPGGSRGGEMVLGR